MPSQPVDSNQLVTDTLVTIDRVSKSRRALTKTLVAAPALASVRAGAQPRANPQPQKVLRYAFRVAETGFDPAQVQRPVLEHGHGQHLRCATDLRLPGAPGQVVPNTAVALPEVSDDFTTFTLRLKPGIHFQDHPAFQGQPARTDGAGLRLFDQARLRPEVQEPARLPAGEREDSSAWRRSAQAALKGANASTTTARSTACGRSIATRFRIQLRASPARASITTSPTTPFSARWRARSSRCYDDKQMMANPVGTGPFRLADWRRSSRIVLERNPGYRDDVYDAAAGRRRRGRGRRSPRDCAAASCRWSTASRSTSSRKTSRAGWRSSTASTTSSTRFPYDLANLVVPNGQLAPNLPEARRSRWTALRAPTSTWRSSTWSTRWSAATRRRRSRCAVRFSLAYAVDDEIRLVRKGQSMPSQSPVAPLTAGYDPTFRSEMSEYNPARAQGAARRVRLRRPRRRRLARAARRHAADARDGDAARPAVAPARRAVAQGSMTAIGIACTSSQRSGRRT